MVTRQDRRPKRMSPLTREHLAESKTAALYRAWKGELFIQDRRVGDLALCSPFSGTIPAQLPAKLEARYVVAVSDLRKKLPAVAFGKNNYANDEVRSQGILFSLYEVEILNQNELKVDQLTESLKEKDLALVHYLNDRGLFILLTSSAWAKEKDSAPEEFPRLQALFVISSPRPTRLAAKDLRCDHGASERSSQVLRLLPALRFALAEAAKDHKVKGVPPGVLVKRHVQELAMLDKNLLPTFTNPDRLSLSFDQFLKKSDLEAVSGTCSQSSFSRLQRYLSGPQNYTLEMPAAPAGSAADPHPPASSRACDAGSSSVVNSSPQPLGGPVQLVETTTSGQPVESAAVGAESTGKPSRGSERNLQRCKRRSSRLLGVSARKKWAPLKVLCIMESNKKRKKSKKKKPEPSAASSKVQGPLADAGEPTLKLKNLQYPMKRKRGAEVLSAEFVHRTRHEPAAKAPSAPEGPGAERKKPRLLSCRKSVEAEKVEKIKRWTIKKRIHHHTNEAGPEIHGDENAPAGERPAPRDACPPLRKDECDSHALNMLADLALSSFDSLFLANARRAGLPHSPSRERRPLPRGKLFCKASDHEYHRINAKLKGASLPLQSLSPPGQPDQSTDSPPSPREGGRVGSGKKKGVRPHPAQTHAALPTETRDRLDPSVPALISTEHSYASLASEPLLKQLPWRGPPSPPHSKNGVKSAKSGPLVGKVLPFRHQQNICHPHRQFRTYLPFSRSALMAARPKEDFGKSRKVTFCDQSVRVTCQWEAEYLFSLDSKYTNHPLEKTIVRAVHGPWDMRLSDDVEEMKLILHMWVALFYSKPIRSPSVRKVVEHSNPAKYVSLNTAVDPLELVDDGEGLCGAGKRPADSLSEACRAPDRVGGRARPPEEKPLSCNELSSTNCLENEAPLADPAETSDLSLDAGSVSSLACDLLGPPQASDEVPGKEAEEEFFRGPLTSARSQSGGPSNGHGSSRPDTQAEANTTVDSVEVSQSSPVLSEPPEITKDTQGVTSTGNAISTEKLERSNTSSSAEGDRCPIGGIESLQTSGAAWLEANAEYGKDKPLLRGEGDLEDEEDVEVESVELVSIDLTLSDSNDADAEPRDVDLEQENEDLAQEDSVAEETCASDAASPGDSLTTFTPSLAASPLPQAAPEPITESPGDQDDPAGLTPRPAFLNRTDSTEGVCAVQNSERDSPAGLHPLEDVPFHQVILDEGTGSARTGDAVESPQLPASPDRTDLVKHDCIAPEDQESCRADSVSLHATELNRIRNDLVTEEDSVGSQEDFLVSGKSQTFSKPRDPGGVSKAGKATRRPDSALQETQPAHPSRPDEISELVGNQEGSAEPSQHPVSSGQMDVAEAESQEDVPLAESACALGQVQNSIVVVGEDPVGNQSDSLVSAKNLEFSKLWRLIDNSYISQEGKGTHLRDSGPFQNHLADRTLPGEAVALPENGEDSVTSAPSPEYPSEGLGAGSRTGPEEEDMNVADTDPLEASHQVIQGEQKTRQMSEALGDAVEDEEIQCLGSDGSQFGANREGTSPHDENEGNGPVSCDDHLHQVAATLSEEIKSLLCELIDTVSSLNVESEGACSKEDSGFSWIRSMALECVTPPESDDESPTADQVTSSNPDLVVGEHLESQEDGQCCSTSRDGLSSHRVAWAGRQPSEGNETDILTSCTDWAKLGTPILDSKFQLAETAVSSKSNDSAISLLSGEVGLGPPSHETSVLAREGSPFREENVEILACVPGGFVVAYASEESDSSLHGGTSEKRGDPEDAADVQLASERAELPAGVLGPNMNRTVESLSAEGDKELFGDPPCRNPSASPCYTRSVDSRGVPGATYVRDLSPAEEISVSHDWVYLGDKTRVMDVEPEAKCFGWPFTPRRDDRPALPSLRADGEERLLKDYINFSITTKHKDKSRTFHLSKRGGGSREESGLINSVSRTWRVLDDPVRNMLDMECLRFHYKLKQIRGKEQPHFSTSSNLFAKEFATQVTAGTLPLRKVPGGPVLNMPPWSRSPLLVTIVNPSARRSAVHWNPRIRMPDNSFDPPPPRASLSQAAGFKSKGRKWPAPFHLNKLTYNNKLKDSRGDISVIMDEFAELSRVMKSDDRQTSNRGQDPKTTSEEVPEKRCQSLPGRMISYQYLFDDLCNTLHFRLQNVAKEACKKPFSFYVVETDGDPFFERIKNLLKKAGHLEADPQLFCKASRPETDRLVVIIRNEDIFLHVHKIPSLLRLKHVPNVTFAGVDSPEDILDHTYQELFHSGGFMVSDDQVLETMTMGELKDVVRTLEQLSGHRKWRWLLHYKETKKLRESARVDSAARSKDLILRSCQGADFTQVLHYHRCDSRSAPRSEYLNCLLNLQVQHIGARLAVFLTENPSASREALESKGILVLDVNTFVATAQDLAASCRSNY